MQPHSLWLQNLYKNIAKVCDQKDLHYDYYATGIIILEYVCSETYKISVTKQTTPCYGSLSTFY